MPEEIVVEPRVGAEAPAAAPAETKAPELSDELLRVPAIQAIFAGQPAGFSADLKTFEKRPESKLIMGHKDELMRAGMGLYRSLDGARGVVFNSLYLHPDELKQADQAGQLESVAPDFDQVNDSVASSGDANPVLKASVPSGMKAAPVNTASAPLPPPQPASAQKNLASKRVQNLQPAAPTSGSAPGGGNLLRSILRPVL